MDKTLAADIISAGLDKGADFVELFEEETRNASVALKDKKIENATAGIEYGIGLRLLYGTDVVYGYTGSDTRDALTQLLNALITARGETAIQKQKLKHQALPVIVHAPRMQEIRKHPRDAGQAAKLPLLQKANAVGYSISPKVVQVAVSLADSHKKIEIANSDGLFIADERTRTRFSVSVTAESEGERFVAGESPGSLAGFEFFENIDIAHFTRLAAERALRMLSAKYIEGKKMPIILGNGFGGVIFHEACGHPLETEAVRKKATPFADKVGQMIAHPNLTAIDDGTIFGSWGSIAIDDEGMPAQKTILIENGILKNFISDRVGALECNVPRTGSARRESYKYSPVSRMRNTYIAAGKNSLDEMLSGVREGLYAPKLGGGSVNPATGEFNFAVEEGYAIRDGKILEPVRGATLIGKGHEILPKISMVGSDLELTAGMCGASSGSVPVTVGQPTLKVDEMLVGGR